MLQGKTLLKTLTSTNPPIPCTYTLLPAIASVMTQVTTVLVGAHSICANGAVYSRAGTAIVAMIAKNHSVPVVVCCETYKFSDLIVLDAFGKNEIGRPLHFFPGLFLIGLSQRRQKAGMKRRSNRYRTHISRC
jgi:translation initiation factor eIF-2B subunit delta